MDGLKLFAKKKKKEKKRKRPKEMMTRDVYSAL